ncbi:transcriptional regulator, partial [Listeria monocytogenes]|nr:transcriptional regulator [Listeria monocytogenes]
CRALECTPNEVISFKTEKVKNE